MPVAAVSALAGSDGCANTVSVWHALPGIDSRRESSSLSPAGVPGPSYKVQPPARLRASGLEAREQQRSVARPLEKGEPVRALALEKGHRVDDSVLIREAQRGNRVAFEELVRHYDQAVLRLALHLTGSEQDAQDIYQEAFLRAYQNLDRFRFESSFYTWIYRIVTNLCLDHLRRRQIRSRQVGVTVSADGEERDPFDRLADARPGSNPE